MYLDGIASQFDRSESGALVYQKHDVFDLSTFVSFVAWKMVRWLYRAGSTGGWVGRLYDRIRSGADYNRPSLALRILGASLRKQFADDHPPLVVAHPSLVGMLGSREHVIYQHGELVAPNESLVRGAAVVLVPTADVAAQFVSTGYSEAQVMVTGLCVEPPLLVLAKSAFQSRVDRINSDQSLTGAFFSSGAEPPAHLASIQAAIESLSRSDQRAIVFARSGGRLAELLRSKMFQLSRETIICKQPDEIPDRLPCLTFVFTDSRFAEDSMTANLFSRFDYLVAPPHERINWAVGLGLPMFALLPTIGSFAPLNLRLVTDRGVARCLSPEESSDLSSLISVHRESGELVRMAEAGWNQLPIDGFANIAQLLQERFGTTQHHTAQ